MGQTRSRPPSRGQDLKLLAAAHCLCLRFTLLLSKGRAGTTQTLGAGTRPPGNPSQATHDFPNHQFPHL